MYSLDHEVAPGVCDPTDVAHATGFGRAIGEDAIGVRRPVDDRVGDVTETVGNVGCMCIDDLYAFAGNPIPIAGD